MDVFPQVDSRILKAVAIEHSKDADLAVEVVLLEVIPFLSRQSAVPSPPHGESSLSLPSDEEAEHEKQTGLRHRRVISVKSLGSSSEPRLVAEEDAGKTDLTSDVNDSDSTHQEKSQDQPMVVSADANADTNQLQGHIESEELILLGEPQRQQDSLQPGSSQILKVVPNALMHEVNADHAQLYDSQIEVPSSLGNCLDFSIRVGHEQTSLVMPTILVQENGELSGGLTDSISTRVGHEQTLQVMPTSLVQENGELSGSLTDSHSQWKHFDCPEDVEFDMVIRAKSSQVESCVDDIASSVTNTVVEQTPDSAEGGLHSDFGGISIKDSENMNSKQNIKIELLDEIIEAAKDNKRTLFSAMESVMNMMKEVELQERAAEQAKEEAASGGLDILVKVEELKQMLVHAKEANDMHAGEVYGEKAILATEVRELQARLLSLSDERDNALAILDEMHQTLESRLAAAEELRKAAELEKLDKEETARNALAEQEIIMEKVVQESKILQKEVEENAKLREFLMDRGCVVDTLQGEISVICQDVRLLKEKFDHRVPLSKSVSSTQTSCILASSGSSVKSMASDIASELGEPSESPKEPSPTCSIHAQSSKSLKAVEKDFAIEKQLLDDGWDLLEE
ncbi:unnamed protein product [Dovyalis caffra]|uniref:CUE domain-containing protein n=1 Tax=Dovyalis caffra TaxID=77055 RepID=A0AAV1SB36_9ROSI|nr:unnamed protein product [Dovyalis caffra]